MEEDFNRDFPEYAKYEKLFDIWLGLQCLLRGEDPMYKERPDEPFKLACYDVAEWVMGPVYAMLKGFAAVVTSGSLPIYQLGHFGIYDPHSSHKLASDREKLLEDEIIVAERLPEYCTIAQYKNGKVPAEDELARGLRAMMQTKQILVWLVFAAQCFLDVHHILRQHIDSGFAQLYKVASKARQTMNEHLDYHKNITIAGWPHSNSRLVDQEIDMLERDLACRGFSPTLRSRTQNLISTSCYIASPSTAPTSLWSLHLQDPPRCAKRWT